jgi:hypothetical protein
VKRIILSVDFLGTDRKETGKWYTYFERIFPFSMQVLLKTLWHALVNAYDAAFTIVLSNILSVILCVPIILVAQIAAEFMPQMALISFFLAALLMVAIASAGLYYTNFQIASGESVDWKTYFEGIKRHWWTGLRWTGLNGIVLFSLTFYFFFFLGRTEFWASALTGLDLGIMAFWILLMFITFPMMMIQEKPGLLSSLRNSLVFLLRWPSFSFTFLLPVLLVVIATLFFPPLGIFLSLGLVAYLSCFAVYYRIESDRHPELFVDPKHIH